MTAAATLANGRGESSYRLEIERLPTQFVTHSSMETATRKPWLSVSGKLKCFSNPVSGEIDVSGLRCVITDKDGGATAIFSKAPAYSTWLTAELSTSATTVTVRSTSGWPSDGYIWIDSEVIKYASLGGGGTTFAGCTRAQYGSLAQAHYVATGGAARYPKVTSAAPSISGCRARLYMYGQNDDPTGDGTQIWLGVVSKQPTLTGAAWSMMIDPITSILSKSLAADLQEPALPRGAAYNWRNTFFLGFTRTDTDEAISVQAPGAAGTTGFFENNDEMATYVNGLLEAAITAAGWGVGFGCAIRMIPNGDSGWYLGIITNATVEVVVSRCSGGIDPVFSLETSPTNIDGTLVAIVSGVESYWLPLPESLPGAGSCPRGYIGASSVGIGGDFTRADAFPINKVYLSGVALGSSIDAVAVEWLEFGAYPKEETAHEVLSTDAATNSAVLDIAFPPGHPLPNFDAHAWTAATAPEFRFGRTYTQSGNIYTALVAIIGLAPTLLNLGAVPDLRSGDLDGTSWNLIDGSDQPRIVRGRRFSSFSDVELMTLVKQELLLAGFMLGINSVGKIAIAPIRGVVRTEVADLTLDSILGVPTWEPSAYGMINQVKISRGYNQLEDDYAAAAVLVRNVAEFGSNPRPRTAEIEPKSVPVGEVESYSECVEVAQRVFSAYSGPYAVIAAEVPLSAYLLGTVGAVASLTSVHIPDYEAGTRGVTGLRAIVLGREVDLNKGTVGMRLLASTASTSGYVPESLITAETNISGNTWDVTLSGSYFPSSTDAADWFIAGDLVTARLWDSTTATEITGSVTSVAANVVRVLFTASAAGLAVGEWFLTARLASDQLSSTQDDYVFLADSTMLVDFDGTNRAARVFA